MSWGRTGDLRLQARWLHDGTRLRYGRCVDEHLAAEPAATEHDGDQGFPPQGVARTPAELAGMLEERMRAMGVELPGLDCVRAKAEAKFAAAKNTAAQDQARYVGAWMMIGVANRQLLSRRDPRRWQGVVPRDERRANRTRWFLVDDAERRHMLKHGYRTLASAMGFHPVTSILAMMAWGFTFEVIREPKSWAIAATTAAYGAWFVARTVLKRRNGIL